MIFGEGERVVKDCGSHVIFRYLKGESSDLARLPGQLSSLGPHSQITDSLFVFPFSNFNIVLQYSYYFDLRNPIGYQSIKRF